MTRQIRVRGKQKEVIDLEKLARALLAAARAAAQDEDTGEEDREAPRER